MYIMLYTSKIYLYRKFLILHSIFADQTEHPSSILLYAAGRTPHYNHVVAILYSGVLHVSMAFDNDELTFQIGIGLDNNR